jgi:hypothetical protein
MHKSILAFFSILLTYYLAGQSVSTQLKSHQFSYTTTGVNVGKYIYLDYLKGTYFNASASRVSLLKLNMNLHVVDSICLSCQGLTDTNYFGFSPIFYGEQGFIYIPFRYRNADSLYTVILEIDTSFSSVRKFKLNIPLDKSRFTFDISSLYTKDSTIYFSGKLLDTSNFTIADAYIVQTDLNGQILHSHILKSDSVSFGPRLIDFNSMVVLDSVLLVTLYGTWNEILAVYDHNLNFLGTRAKGSSAGSFGYYPHYYFVKNSKQSPLIEAITFTVDNNYTPKPDENNWYKNLSLMHLNASFQISLRDTLGYKGWKTDTLAYVVESVEYGTATYGSIKEDTIVCMATDYSVLWLNWPLFQYLNFPTQSFISSFDYKNETTLWSRVYSTVVAHKAEEIIALPNNRWLLVFNEYDWNTYGQDNLAVRLIVIDGNGNPIGINENEQKALEQEPIVYPNPATTHITIGNLHWPGNQYSYQLIDSKGSLVLQGLLPIDGSITLPEALNGVYILTITNQTGFGWARKVVIE